MSSMPTVPDQPAALPELNLREYVEIIRRRKIVFVQVLVMVLAVGIVAASRSKPEFVTSAKLLVTAGNSSVSIVDSNNPIATMLAAAQPDSVDTQLQVIQSGPFLEEATRRAHLTPKKGVAPPSVSAQVVENTNVIEVTGHGGDRQQVADLVNAVVKLHLERSDLMTTTGLSDTLQFVKQEKAKADTQLATAEKKVVAFRQAHRLVGLTSEKEARAGEYAALLARVLEAESNIRSAKQQTASLRAQLDKEPRQLVEVNIHENPRVAKLQDKLDELKFQRMDLVRDYRPASRAVTDIDRQIADLQRQLAAEPRHLQVETYSANPARPLLQTRLQELQSSLQSNAVQQNEAAAQLQAQKELMDSLGPWESDLAQLTSDRDAARSNANMLGDHLRDLQIRAGARLRTARPIEWAGPGSPIQPRRSNSIFLTLILALTLATGTVFLMEYLDDRVNSPEDLERVVPLRALAHVPQMAPHESHLVVDLPMNAPVVEAYRTLRSSIGFAGFDAPIRRLQITSAAKGEGKSTTSMNLATAMAHDHKTVILVDADMRAPSIHRMLGIPHSPGLSEVLAGMVSLEDALHVTDIDNLLVLPAGGIPPNPAELLGSDGFDQLLERLGERSDIVIFDTPPCMPVTDPVIIATHMDAVLLVLRFGASRKVGLKQTIDQLTHARAHLIGVVFNQVRMTGHYYYHAYAYGHYGYGNGNGNGSNGNGAHPVRPHRNGKGKHSDLEHMRAIAVRTSESSDEEA